MATTNPNGSTAVLSIIEEANYGVTPESSILQKIEFVSEALKKEVNALEDETIDSGEQTVSVKEAGIGAAGELKMNLKMDNTDLLIEGLMKSSFESFTETFTDISLEVSTEIPYKNDIVTVAGDFTTNFKVGDFIKLSFAPDDHFNSNDFNRPVKIVALTAKNMTIAGMDLVTEAASFDVTISGTRIANGTDFKSYSIEKKFKDGTNDIVFAYRGSCVNSLALAMPSGDKITESYNIMAKDEESVAGTIGSGYEESIAGEMLDTTNNLVYVLVGNGEIVPASISSLSIENNLRAQKGVGSKSLFGIGKGRQKVSGTLELYFDDKTLYEKFRANLGDSLDVVIQNTDGSKWMVISLPNIKYTEYPVNIAGIDQDIVSAVQFIATKDATLGNQIMISKHYDAKYNA